MEKQKNLIPSLLKDVAFKKALAPLVDDLVRAVFEDDVEKNDGAKKDEGKNSQSSQKDSKQGKNSKNDSKATTDQDSMKENFKKTITKIINETMHEQISHAMTNGLKSFGDNIKKELEKKVTAAVKKDIKDDIFSKLDANITSVVKREVESTVAHSADQFLTNGLNQSDGLKPFVDRITGKVLEEIRILGDGGISGLGVAQEREIRKGATLVLQQEMSYALPRIEEKLRNEVDARTARIVEM